MDILIQFLYSFYKNKKRYVRYITEICLKLDDNNNQTIVTFFLFSKSINLWSLVKFYYTTQSWVPLFSKIGNYGSIFEAWLTKT
jgi:hypothetical protein